jgi:hypothetical protein
MEPRCQITSGSDCDLVAEPSASVYWEHINPYNFLLIVRERKVRTTLYCETYRHNSLLCPWLLFVRV